MHPFRPGDIVQASDASDWLIKKEGFLLGEVIEIHGYSTCTVRVLINCKPVFGEGYYISEELYRLNIYFELISNG